jgi:hypothetical protein
MRMQLELDTQTLRGFRRRVRTDHTSSLQASVLGVPILVFAFIDPVVYLAKAPFDVVWEWFVASPSIWAAAAGVLLIAVTVITTQVQIRRDFALFRQGGWIAFSAPTGLVRRTRDGAHSIDYDHRRVGGSTLYSDRDMGDPLVVLSAARMPVSSFTVATDAVRSSVFRRLPGERSLYEIRQQTSLLDAVPAEAWFPDASGCFLGVTREAPLTVAIPRRLRDGRWRIRLGRVRFTPAEKAALL